MRQIKTLQQALTMGLALFCSMSFGLLTGGLIQAQIICEEFICDQVQPAGKGKVPSGNQQIHIDN